MKPFLISISLFLSLFGIAQNNLLDKHFKEVDSLYREDQFYIGLGINILGDMPDGMRQSGLSGGFFLGYIRDMPINKRRNLSIGVGAGLAIDTYSQNLFIGETEDNNTIFEVIDADVGYSSNRFSSQIIEVPVHLRWRTSKIGENTSFWRIYTGVNVGYMYYFRSTFEQENNRVRQTDLDELNRLRWNLHFSFGKSKINFFANYSLNPLFDGVDVENAPVNVTVFKAGVIFYIL
jgi:hypothetical protein